MTVKMTMRKRLTPTKEMHLKGHALNVPYFDKFIQLNG